MLRDLRNLAKPLEIVGSVSGLVSNTVSTCANSANIIKEKVNSSVTEEKIEQAKQRILVKAAAIKEIAEALNCTNEEAEQILNNELAKGE